jgi:hypothetical protein
VVVGSVLVVGGVLATMAMDRVADDRADRIRRALRQELVAVPDETLADYPGTRDAIEGRAARAVDDLPGRVVGSIRGDGDGGRDGPVVVAVETRWGIQSRCVTAELRGDATVLTDVDSGGC